MVNRKSKSKNKSISLNFFYWFVPLIILLVGISLLVVYVNAVNNVSIEKIRITDIMGFSSSGLTVKADVKINNPSLVDLKVKKIEYKLILGDKVSSYSIKDFSLPARKVTIFKIEQKVSWGLSFDFIKDKLLGKDTLLVLKGKVIIMDSPIVIEIPFEENFDMVDELTDYMAKESKDTANNVIDGVKKGTKKIINGITDLFT